MLAIRWYWKGTIRWAKDYGVAVGAHIGLPDRQGFGRREINITAEELRTDMIYQLGAMDGFLKLYGLKMQHVKPHGILYRMVGENPKYIDAFLDAAQAYNPDLYIMLHTGCEALQRAENRGLKIAPEILVDLGYDANGNWMIERVKKSTGTGRSCTACFNSSEKRSYRYHRREHEYR